MAENSAAYNAGFGKVKQQRQDDIMKSVQGAIDLAGFGVDIWREVAKAEEARWNADKAEIKKKLDGVVYGNAKTGEEGLYSNLIGLDDAVKASDAESYTGVYMQALDGVLTEESLMEMVPGLSQGSAHRYLEEFGEDYRADARRIAANDFVQSTRSWLDAGFKADANLSSNDAGMDAASFHESLVGSYGGGAKDGFVFDPSGASNPDIPMNWATYSTNHATVRAKTAIEEGILSGKIRNSDEAKEYARKLYQDEYAPLYDSSDPTSAYYAQSSMEQTGDNAASYYDVAYRELSQASANREMVASGVLANISISSGRAPTIPEIRQAFADAGGDPQGNFFDANSQWALVQRFAGKGAANATASLDSAVERYRGKKHPAGETPLEGFVKAAGEEGYSESSLASESEAGIAAAGNAISAEESRREGLGISAALDELMGGGYGNIPKDMIATDAAGVSYRINGVTGQIESPTEGMTTAVQQAVDRYNNIRAADPDNTVYQSYSSHFMPYYRSLMEKHGITSPEGQISFMDAATDYEKIVQPTIGTDYLATIEALIASDKNLSSDQLYAIWDAYADSVPMTFDTYNEGRKLIGSLSGGTEGDRRLDEIVAYADERIGTLAFKEGTGDKEFFSTTFFSEYTNRDNLLSLYKAKPDGTLDTSLIDAAINSAYRIFASDNSWRSGVRAFNKSAARELGDSWRGARDEVIGLSANVNDQASTLYSDYRSGVAMWADDDLIEEIVLASATDVSIDPKEIRERISQDRYGMEYGKLSKGRQQYIDANIATGLMISSQETILENALQLDMTQKGSDFYPVQIKETGRGFLTTNGAIITVSMDGSMPPTFVAIGGVEEDIIARIIGGDQVTISMGPYRKNAFYLRNDDIYSDPIFQEAVRYVTTGEGMPVSPSPLQIGDLDPYSDDLPFRGTFVGA